MTLTYNDLTPVTPPVAAARQPKETRAEKNRRLQAERDAEQRRKKQEQLEKNPLRLLKLLARAELYRFDGVSYRIHDGYIGIEDQIDPLFRVTFSFERGGGFTDETNILYLVSDDWIFQSVEDEFDRIDAEKAEAARKLQDAREAYDLLSENQRKALNLTRRP